MPNMPVAPDCYEGSLASFVARHSNDLYLPSEVVEAFHHALVRYINNDDPIFLIRTVGQLQRRCDYENDVAALRPTDNAPAWHVHAKLFYDGMNAFSDFSRFIECMPCHMFSLRDTDHANGRGWHYAHIENTNNRDTNWQQFSRKELTRRMVRNFHPCNYFFVPKSNWQETGGQKTVIEWHRSFFAQRYASIWPSFVELAEGSNDACIAADTSFLVRPRLQRATGNLQPARPAPTGLPQSEQRPAGRIESDVEVTYHHSRLYFKRDKIEPLKTNDRFRVITRDFGSFSMSKTDFYRVFPNVSESASYTARGEYHYRTPPQHALQFRD